MMLVKQSLPKLEQFWTSELYRALRGSKAQDALRGLGSGCASKTGALVVPSILYKHWSQAVLLVYVLNYFVSRSLPRFAGALV